MWKRLLTLGLILAFSGCATAAGDLGYDDDFGAFDDWDTNNDLGIDQNEWGVGFENEGVFNTFDEDDSGILEEDEWDNDWGTFNTFDEDNSFGVDEDEFETGLFDTFDTDDDFGIDENEWGTGWDGI